MRRSDDIRGENGATDDRSCVAGCSVLGTSSPAVLEVGCTAINAGGRITDCGVGSRVVNL